MAASGALSAGGKGAVGRADPELGGIEGFSQRGAVAAGGCAFRPCDGSLTGDSGDPVALGPGDGPPGRSARPAWPARNPPTSANRLSIETSLRAWTSLIRPSSR